MGPLVSGSDAAIYIQSPSAIIRNVWRYCQGLWISGFRRPPIQRFPARRLMCCDDHPREGAPSQAHSQVLIIAREMVIDALALYGRHRVAGK